MLLAAAVTGVTGQDAQALADHGTTGIAIFSQYASYVLMALVLGIGAVYLRLRTRGDVQAQAERVHTTATITEHVQTAFAASQERLQTAFVDALEKTRADFMNEINASRAERQAMALAHEQYVTQTGAHLVRALEQNTAAQREVTDVLRRIPCLDSDCPSRILNPGGHPNV